MITVKELIKVFNKEEISVISGNTKDEKNKNIILAISKKVFFPYDIVALYDEYVKQESIEATYSLYISKFESDIQAKLYELDGYFNLDNAIKDIEYYPEELKTQILPTIQNASDGWLQFDRTYYTDNELFTSLSKELQKITKRN